MHITRGILEDPGAETVESASGEEEGGTDEQPETPVVLMTSEQEIIETPWRPGIHWWRRTLFDPSNFRKEVRYLKELVRQLN
ncbi:UNVERIFIED_CONTAM: hypothetical protein K2H54_014527 [Gekko kuhli]